MSRDSVRPCHDAPTTKRIYSLSSRITTSCKRHTKFGSDGQARQTGASAGLAARATAESHTSHRIAPIPHPHQHQHYIQMMHRRSVSPGLRSHSIKLIFPTGARKTSSSSRSNGDPKGNGARKPRNSASHNGPSSISL